MWVPLQGERRASGSSASDPDLPEWVNKIILCIMGFDPLVADPTFIENRQSGFLYTLQQTDQTLHRDQMRTDMWSAQVPLEKQGFSVQFLPKNQMAVDKINLRREEQTWKVYCPDDHMLLWNSKVYHCGCFGSKDCRCLRYHTSIPASQEMSNVILGGSQNIYRRANASRRDFFTCNGDTFKNV